MSTRDIYGACQQAIADFYAALDGFDEVAMGSFFADDGVWLRQGERLVGPQAVDTALARRPTGRLSLHQVTNLQLRAQAEQQWQARYLVQVYRHDGTPDSTGPRPLNEALFAVMQVVDIWRQDASGALRLVSKQGKTLFRREAAAAPESSS